MPGRRRPFQGDSAVIHDPDGFTIEFAHGERGHNATDPGYWSKLPAR